MSRPILILIVLALLLIGGVFYLSSSADEVPTRTIETEVKSEPAAN